ncbi:hypothetical protein SAMN00120144_3281 [Hymenobacter roseosalivarius DSM 11622]|uniref:Macroglobulin domain-containing protein n=1 Tax=Hymenobacter roseosalivarius DSM 11622 TaxID=645990 RepID=A0A1W1V9N8_9BACT|nr:hypothetical protein [Hymenobacter roseosalivarius]SMB90109.1 hypothetical protein SAMN00120144_3281 [Hymenobacter roseosalivarius DSM 11622]
MTKFFTQRLLTGLLLLSHTLVAQAQKPALLLDVVRFRNENTAIKGAVVELYVTVAGQALLYRKRAPKVFQAAAVVMLEARRPDGSAAYQETITLKPPVLNDTSSALKNPVNFQKRIELPDGQYTLRATVQDQTSKKSLGKLEQSLTLDFDQEKTRLSDIVLLSRVGGKSAVEGDNFTRGGYSLARTPNGLYARGADRLAWYAELYDAPSPLVLATRARIRSAAGGPDVMTAAGLARPVAGAPHLVLGDMNIANLMAGDYNLIIEVRDAKGKLLTSQTARLQRRPDEYAPAAATVPR